MYFFKQRRGVVSVKREIAPMHLGNGAISEEFSYENVY